MSDSGPAGPVVGSGPRAPADNRTAEAPRPSGRDGGAPTASSGARLRELLERERPLLLAGCADALTARIAESVGFSALYATGAGISNALLGLPDVGLASMGEVLGQVAHICDAVEVPVVADIDTGYGGALNCYRTVREFERAGVAAVQIEDQVFPKRCGHFSGQQVLERGEMLGKLRATLDARRDAALVVIARTDAIGAGLGVDEAVDRACAYVEAGADVVFVEAPTDVTVLGQLPGRIPAPLLVNMVEGGKTPLLDAARLAGMGYRVVLFANTALRAAALAAREALHALRRDGSSAAILDRLLSWEERQRLVRLPEFESLSERYS